MVQKISRALSGSFSGGRSTMAENSARWLGNHGSHDTILTWMQSARRVAYSAARFSE